MKGKYAFFDLKGSGGDMLDFYLQEVVFEPNGVSIFHSWNDELERNWNLPELQNILAHDIDAAYLYNKADGWNEELFDSFQENGWQFFLPLRYPGNQLCEEFFSSSFDEHRKNYTLDQFITETLHGKNQALPPGEMFLPNFWKKFDHLIEPGFENIELLLWKLFELRADHIKWPKQMATQGYAYFRSVNLISDESDQLLRGSNAYLHYREAQESLFSA